MRIDGKEMAEMILAPLVAEVMALKQNGVTPTLAVIQVGEDPGSTAYITQKRKAAERLGAKLIHTKLPLDTTASRINKTIEQYNNDSTVHGIILQRPLPGTLSDAGAALTNIVPSKDVDGLLPHSPFPVPIATAVERILAFCFQQYNNRTIQQFEYSAEKQKRFHEWLKTISIVVLGRGETAGKPIAGAFIKKGCNVSVVHSQTPNPDEKIRSADIIVSCVGKPNIVRRDNVKNGAILVSVGLWRDDSGNLRGDYEEGDIRDVASFYTPTPGGVGPMNVACLMANLVQAANKLL